MRHVFKLTEQTYVELRESHCGFCLSCHALNDGFHEPDAENYECDSCGKHASHGIENVLIMGLVELVDDASEENI